MFAIPGMPWLKLLAALVLLGVGFAVGHSNGHASGYTLGYAEGVKIEDTKFAAAIAQQQADAKHQFDDAVSRNNQLKDDYDHLKAQWQIDHDTAARTQATLSAQLTVRGADNDRLRRAFATASTASRGSCAGTPGSGTPDPAVGEGVSTAAAGSVRGGVDQVSQQPFDVIANLLRRADDVVIVANECSAAIQVK